MSNKLQCVVRNIQTPLILKGCLLGAYALIVTVWVYYHVRKLRPGVPRIAAIAPLLALSPLIPLLFDADTEFLARLVTSAGSLWILNFKVGEVALILVLTVQSVTGSKEA